MKKKHISFIEKNTSLWNTQNKKSVVISILTGPWSSALKAQKMKKVALIIILFIIIPALIFVKLKFELLFIPLLIPSALIVLGMFLSIYIENRRYKG